MDVAIHAALTTAAESLGLCLSNSILPIFTQGSLVYRLFFLTACLVHRTVKLPEQCSYSSEDSMYISRVM